MQKNQKFATLIVAFLIIIMTSSIAFTPTTNAHTPPWTFPSYSYLVASPDPVGVGQKVSISMWADYPLPSAAVTNDIRRHDYTLTITAPDGKTQTQHWDAISDSTGIQSISWTPDQVGTYTLKFVYGGQTYTWTGTYQNDIYSGSSRTISLTVQQQAIPQPSTSLPLPTEYWTHPIEGQNTNWWVISSNWLGSPQIVNRFQPYGLAPNSAHVMWSKSIAEGGVVGGMMGPSADQPVKTFYMGGSYNVRWSNPLIMNGILYYELPLGNSGSGGGYVADDLRTGKELWRVNTTATGTSLLPSFGFLYSFDDGNQHGVLPNGALFASTTVSGQGTVWRSYDPDTGIITNMNITNVPTGTSVQGPKGEILRYTLTNFGNTANPLWKLQEWNSTKLWASAGGLGPSNWYTGFINASLASRYDFNITLNLLNSAAWTINSYAKYGYGMLLTQGSFGGRADTYYGGNWYGANVTYVSLNPSTMGQVLWTKNFAAAAGNVTRALVAVDYDTGVFIFEDQETLVHWGYSLADGSLLWGPTPPVDQFDYFRSTTRVAYGNFYFAGYGGILYCYNDKTGNLKWTYGNGGAGNSTSSSGETAWGVYPLFMPVVADGKVFLDSTEHSPDSPFYKGEQVRAINATDGTEIWTLDGWGTGMDANYDIAADGFYTYLNCYDMKVYVIGKGPSALTVDAPSNGITLGSSLVIRGTVTDISAGTTQDEQAARFPHGVPAVSDKSQTGWMEYVYMQKPMPTNAIGVPVSIDVVDANGNYRNIGTATSDSSGAFSLQWTPDITGQYFVIAKFAGSESYWPSSSETSFAVDKAAPTASPFPVTVLPPTEMYIGAAAIAIIIAVAIATVLIIMMLRKRP